MGRQDNVPEYQCTSPEDKYPRTFKVDPFPCYTHDEERVKVMADLCQNAFPVPNLNIYILSHEMIDRINGLSYEQPSYSEEEKIPCKCGCGELKTRYGQILNIVLSGKRIPVLPSMTRYLVTHEYGHVAFYYIVRKMGYQDGDIEKIEKEYLELRGIEYKKNISLNKWHNTASEIIANDFRILFTKQEMEFYPHDVELPSWGGKEGIWWKKALEICK